MSEISCFYLGSVWLLGEYSLRSRQIRSSFRIMRMLRSFAIRNWCI
uniref:Uncharacterized protein n=1 Tax=Physcomitrium patens TaxID=3218 RepID=A0A7I4FES9_PHYPA